MAENRKITIVKKKSINVSNKKAFLQRMEEWVGYWRANPHRFVEEYLGLPFKGEFQKLWFDFIDYNINFIAACSRGLAKKIIKWSFIWRHIKQKGQNRWKSNNIDYTEVTN